MKQSKTYLPIILILAFIKFILPFILQSPVYELHRDEYLYFSQGQHLDFGFLENPPLMAVFAKISSFAGGSFFWVKFWPSLFGAATLIVACFITIETGGKIFAIILTGLSLITGAFLRIHFLFQPNVLDIFFWTLAFYFLVRFIKQKDQHYIFMMAITMAIGWWSKYTIAFAVAATLIGILLTQYRTLYLKRNAWLAALLALLIIAPNILWQYLHKWPLLHHVNELYETQLRYINPGDFIKDQFLMTLPVFFIWLTGLIWCFRKKEWRVIGWIYVMVIGLLIYTGGKNYYSLGIYPLLFAFGSTVLERITKSLNWLRVVMIVFISGFTFYMLPLALPMQPPAKLSQTMLNMHADKMGILRWEDLQNHSLPQDFADMLGWKELAEKSEKFYQSLPDTSRSNTAIFCRNYGQAGALQYYGSNSQFKNSVFSDNGSFLLWISGPILFHNLLFVGGSMPDKDDEVFQHFEKVTVIDSVTNNFSRQLGDKIIFFENIDSTGLQLARERIKKEKVTFNR